MNDDILESERKANSASSARFGVAVDAEPLPTIKDLRFVDEAGQLTDKKPEVEEDVVYFWRHHQKTLALVIVVAGGMLAIMMLGAFTPYLDAALNGLFGLFWWGVSFILGLFSGG